MNPSHDALSGHWRPEDEDSEIIFSFAKIKGGYGVSGYSTTDGEEFVFDAIAWNGQFLSFSSLMPSTSCLNWHSFSTLPDGDLDDEFTTYDLWKKRAQSGATNVEGIYGLWEVASEDMAMVFYFSPPDPKLESGCQVQVTGLDEMTGKWKTIRNIQFQDRELSFETESHANWTYKIKFQFLTPETAKMELKEHATWVRAETSPTQ